MTKVAKTARLSSAEKLIVASTKCLLATQCGLAISEHKQSIGAELHKKMEAEFFARLSINEKDLSDNIMHHCKYSTFTCNSILVGRNIWDKYREGLHCIKNILMPAFKSVINESGSNLDDALNKTRWAHWVFKTNSAAKAKWRKASKATTIAASSTAAGTGDSTYDSSTDGGCPPSTAPTAVVADDCPSKETYMFPEYETFVEFHTHALLSREMSRHAGGKVTGDEPKKARARTELIKKKVSSRKTQRKDEHERKKKLRETFEASRESKASELAARKKAKVALAADCVQHKWCLLAQSCGMDAEVKKIVQTKMSKILKTVVQDQEKEREEEREKEETDTLLDTSLVEGDEEGNEDNDSRNSDDEDDDSRNSDDEDDGEEEDIYK